MNHRPEHLAAFVKSLANEMLTYCGPIFIAPGLRTYPKEMIDNGTYSLVDTGQRRLLITCNHVWQAFLERRAEYPESVLALNLGEGTGSIAFAHPERQLIDTDSTLDLAVFDFEPNQIRTDGVMVNHQKDWFPVRQWPIAKVRDGEHVMLMGFSGKRVKKVGMLCTFVTQVLPLSLSGVGSREMYIFNEGENTEVFNDMKNWLGGLSGSPAYVLGKDGASLVGFVKSGFKRTVEEGNLSDSSVFAGCLSLTHASFLQRDGTLTRP